MSTLNNMRFNINSSFFGKFCIDISGPNIFIFFTSNKNYFSFKIYRINEMSRNPKPS